LNTRNKKAAELLISGVNNQQKTKPKEYRYTSQQVEMACLRAQGNSLSQIAKKLGIKTGGQVSASLTIFEPVAKQMFQDVEKLMHAGYRKQLLKEAGYFHDLMHYGLEIEEKMLREGRWPWAIPKHRHVRFCLIIGENREIQLDPTRAEKTKKYFNDVVNGVVPKQAAEQNGIPRFWAHMILDDPIFKGLYAFRHKFIPIPGIQVVCVETWNKAHKMHVYWATHGKKRKRAPLGTKWLGNVLVPYDPDNILGRIRELRLKKYGSIRIAREVGGISEGAVHKALQPQRIKLYIKLGLGTPEEWEKVRNIKVGPEDYNKDRGADHKAAILKALHESKDGLTASQLRTHLKKLPEAVELSQTVVYKHLYELSKVVEKEPKHNGRWRIKT
jgi:DNA-binding transcriptional ArsR family regulator